MNELTQFPPMINRREFMQLSAGSLVLAACGCTERPSRDPDSTITVAFSDVGMSAMFTDDNAMHLVFLPLVARNADGELEGRLAERWEHSPDYRIWTVHLRPGVRWQDGVPVTAHDVKFTLDLLSSPEWVFTQPDLFTVTVLDDSTYTIEYHHQLADRVGFGSPLDDYTVYYPKHLLQQLDPGDRDSWESWFSHPVGNGPYRFVRYAPKTAYEFEANPDYYRGKPSIEHVILKVAGSNVTELLSGNVDVAGASRNGLLALSKDDRFRVYHSSDPSPFWMIAWNLRNELFRDASVRRALTLAINRVELRQALDIPAGPPIFDVLLSDGQYRRGEVPDPLPYDPERARQLLQEAGWRDDDGDGVLERDGRPFRFSLLSSVPGGREGEAVYIKSQLRRVGIDVEVETMNGQLVRIRVKESQFEAVLYIGTKSLDSGAFGVLSLFGEESLFGYANRDVIALLDELKSTIDPDEVDRIHRQLAPIFEADLPVTFLYQSVGNRVASRRVRGLSSPYRTDALSYMDELWLEAESESHP